MDFFTESLGLRNVCVLYDMNVYIGSTSRSEFQGMVLRRGCCNATLILVASRLNDRSHVQVQQLCAVEENSPPALGD